MKFMLTLLLLLQFFTLSAQKLVSYKVLPCNETIGLNFYKNRLITKFQNYDTLYLQISFVDNCGIQYNGNIGNKKDRIILNFENISKAAVACKCHFFLDSLI